MDSLFGGIGICITHMLNGVIMRNRVLSLTRNVIPYVKELRVFTDSVVGCILMQQLDYWFERYPDGFYKFLEGSDHPKYVAGQSWSEEIGISSTEFRTAFDKIGIRWKSKTEFEQSEDKFQGQFYASYQDKRANLTFYFRNHELVDAALDRLLFELNTPKTPTGNDDKSSPTYKKANINKQVTVNDLNQSTGTEESSSPVNNINQSTANQQQSFTGSEEHEATVNEGNLTPELNIAHSQEMSNPSLEYTDTTISDITSNKLLLPNTVTDDVTIENRSSSDLILFLPTSIDPTEQTALRALVSKLDITTAQNVLDEVCGIKKAGNVKVSLASITNGLVKKAEAGQFNPAAGISIKRERERTKQEQLKKQSEKKQEKPKTRSLIPLHERLATAGVKLHGTPRFDRNNT